MKLPDRFVWRPRDLLRELGQVLNLVPYLAILATPFGFAVWVMGLGGNATMEEIEASWWFKGYLAMILFIPSMAVCALLEWWSRRRGWMRVRAGVRIFRWTHFLAAFGPIVVLILLP
ncbi:MULTISPECIES: hypothetical protein [unclassified Aureimonas]|uniref:hypothetical protein n=1 Tax=unclassified Aureimonas TaxID=2615206 RepID=UPI000722F1A9|nr:MULTISPECIES: hypothetical protein [unclassified Aureimonas]ALN75015.1 hypothetical protein M673_20005 [Aureimonas sp. AU20]